MNLSVNFKPGEDPAKKAGYLYDLLGRLDVREFEVYVQTTNHHTIGRVLEINRVGFSLNTRRGVKVISFAGITLIQLTKDLPIVTIETVLLGEVNDWERFDGSLLRS